MTFDAIRLGLGVLWLVVAVAAVGRGGENGTFMALAALALAAWNLSRWYFTRSVPATNRPPLRRRGESGAEEYHPEFDLTKRDDG